MRQFLKSALAILAAFATGLGTASPAEEVKLDLCKVAVPQIAADSTIFIKTFSTDNVDLGTGKKKHKEKARETAESMKEMAPSAFTAAFISHLKKEGQFLEVLKYGEGETGAGESGEGQLGEGALLVEGEFTLLNPGSRGKRHWVGFGAGKSKICVKGHVVNAQQEELATFEDCRSGNLGLFGGRAEGMMVTDIYKGAYYLADFMVTWAKGDLPTSVTEK